MPSDHMYLDTEQYSKEFEENLQHIDESKRIIEHRILALKKSKTTKSAQRENNTNKRFQNHFNNQ